MLLERLKTIQITGKNLGNETYEAGTAIFRPGAVISGEVYEDTFLRLLKYATASPAKFEFYGANYDFYLQTRGRSVDELPAEVQSQLAKVLPGTLTSSVSQIGRKQLYDEVKDKADKTEAEAAFVAAYEKATQNLDSAVSDFEDLIEAFDKVKQEREERSPEPEPEPEPITVTTVRAADVLQNAGKFTVTYNSNQSTVALVATAELTAYESDDPNQGTAKWMGLLITVDHDLTDDVYYKSSGSFAKLTQTDIQEAQAAGATGTKTLVWWTKAEAFGGGTPSISFKKGGSGPVITLQTTFEDYKPPVTVDTVPDTAPTTASSSIPIVEEITPIVSTRRAKRVVVEEKGE